MPGSDDLVPILTPQAGPGVRFRQGVVRQWNSGTGANAVDVAGVWLSDLPILNTSDAGDMAPGDVVGLLSIGAQKFKGSLR